MASKLRSLSAVLTSLFVLLLPLVFFLRVATSQPAPPQPLDPGFHAGAQGLSPSARAGREIWFKSTAGNARFHTYVFQQRLGVMIDWFRVLRSEARGDRFKTWGIINDPECCTPGSANCPRRSLEETFGFDYCPGDDALLSFVGKEGYRDPACDFQDAPVERERPTWPEGSASERMRPRVRDINRRPRLQEVSQPALQRRAMAIVERLDGDVDRLQSTVAGDRS